MHRVRFEIWESSGGSFVFLPFSDSQHWPAKIRPDHLCRRTPFQFHGQVSSPACDVQHDSILSIQDLSQFIGYQPAPPLVDIEREQVIEQIVPTRNPRKHLANGFGVGSLFYGLV